MFGRKSFCLILTALIFSGFCLWAGDTAAFVDLGFSTDGNTYMFAQYGVEETTLKPWVDLGVVDVSRNNYVPGGKLSYTHTSPVSSGQDGSGALYRIISQNAPLANRYGVDFLLQGRPIYISVENGNDAGIVGGEIVEFRDFQSGAAYKAALTPTFEGRGENLKSSFIINLNRTTGNGSKQTYTVGTPQVKRPQITAYRIRKVLVGPNGGSIVFIIEMRRPSGDGFDIRYMIESLKL
jgi:predicted secreted protein